MTVRSGISVGCGYDGWSSARCVAGVFFLCVVLGVSGRMRAETHYANPGDDLRDWTAMMNPGDTLILNPGEYHSLIRMVEKNGDPDNWFTIRGPDEGTATVVFPEGWVTNLIEFKNSSYWRVENLVLDGNNFNCPGADAFKTMPLSDETWDYAHHIVLDGVEICDFDGTGISTKVSTWDMEVRNCYIHDVHNPGAYLGNSNGQQPIINLSFEHNFIERTGSYNIQVKHQWPRAGVARGDTPGLEFDSWGWLVKDNVFMRTEAAAVNPRPNFLIDAAPTGGPGSDDLATICGNVVLANSAGINGDNGFQLSGNVLVYNNIIMNVAKPGVPGIRIGEHITIRPRHVELYNNTVIILGGAADTRCLQVSRFETTPGLTQVIANNVLIRGDVTDTAYVEYADYQGLGSLPPGAIVVNNIIRGTIDREAGPGPGLVQTFADLEDIFVNPVETPGLADLYPVSGSVLIDAGDNPYAPGDDFSGVARPTNGVAEVGAYEVLGPDNPGWQLDLGFKGAGPPVPGDLDEDGDVDLYDYTMLVGHLSGPVAVPAYYENDGLVVIEAEHFDGIADGVAPVDDAWVLQTGGGSIGDGYVQALPDNGDNVNDPDIESLSPRLSYAIKFTTAGATYYLWTRGTGPNGLGDSFHYGLDGDSISGASADAVSVAATGQFGWSSNLGAAGRPAVYIASPGVYTLDIWMREDACMIDRLLLTTNPSYAPSAPDDPPESPRQPSVGDLDGDGDVDLDDVAILAVNFTGSQ